MECEYCILQHTSWIKLIFLFFSLKNEVGIIMDNMKKHVEHKDTLKMMNDALKRQVDLVKEECELRIKVSKSYYKK